ncbi:MAG: QueT transporter family protein [Oscillospiraceae bacterium]|nr:QueT transporter family protein [Oscillospiraceae bacterium]
MNNSTRKLQRICLAAVVAALYTVLTLMLPMLSYGPVQIRFSEALTILPFLFPETIPGLAVGCFLSNLIGSPYPLDWVFGTLATLVAAIWTSRCRHRWFAPLPPVIANAVIIGAEIAISTADIGSQAFWVSWGWNAVTVGFGELIACYLLGLLLLQLLPRLSYIRRFIPEQRLALVTSPKA